MSARNHVEAMNRRAKRAGRTYETQLTRLALVGSNLAVSASVLLRRMRGAIDTGDLTISGTEDMAEAVRAALDQLEIDTQTFERISKNPEV